MGTQFVKEEDPGGLATGSSRDRFEVGCWRGLAGDPGGTEREEDCRPDEGSGPGYSAGPGDVDIRLAGEVVAQSTRFPVLLVATLLEAFAALRGGNTFAVVPTMRSLTTQEAADFLQLSRPFLIALLEQGEIPFHDAYDGRGIRLSDLRGYLERVRDPELLLDRAHPRPEEPRVHRTGRRVGSALNGTSTRA